MNNVTSERNRFQVCWWAARVLHSLDPGMEPIAPTRTRHACMHDLAAHLTHALTFHGASSPVCRAPQERAGVHVWCFGAVKVVVEVSPGEMSLAIADDGIQVFVRSSLVADTLVRLVAERLVAR